MAKGANLGLPQANSIADRRIPEYEHVGRLVNHSSRVLLLGSAGVWQYGWIAGRYWPGQSDLSWERVQDRLPPMNADERFRTTPEATRTLADLSVAAQTKAAQLTKSVVQF